MDFTDIVVSLAKFVIICVITIGSITPINIPVITDAVPKFNSQPKKFFFSNVMNTAQHLYGYRAVSPAS